MARMGKEFTTAFYARASETAATISKSYFDGCSQGGREALVAAARFPTSLTGSSLARPPSILRMSVFRRAERPSLRFAPPMPISALR
jgi:hypothetical protein